MRFWTARQLMNRGRHYHGLIGKRKHGTHNCSHARFLHIHPPPRYPHAHAPLPLLPPPPTTLQPFHTSACPNFKPSKVPLPSPRPTSSSSSLLPKLQLQTSNTPNINGSNLNNCKHSHIPSSFQPTTLPSLPNCNSLQISTPPELAPPPQTTNSTNALVYTKSLADPHTIPLFPPLPFHHAQTILSTSLFFTEGTGSLPTINPTPSLPTCQSNRGTSFSSMLGSWVGAQRPAHASCRFLVSVQMIVSTAFLSDSCIDLYCHQLDFLRLHSL